MQSCSGLVHYNYAALFPQILSQLDSLAFPAGQRAKRLSQRQI